MAAISLTELTKIFLRAGNLTFGGGDPTMALLHRELVEKRGALTPQQYGASFALARITPGTNVLAFSAAAGYLMRGWPGALIAVIISSVPSSFIVLAATRIADENGQHPLLQAVIQALVAVAIALIAATVWNLARPSWKPGSRVKVLVLIGLSATATYFSLLPPIAILALAALCGVFIPL